MVGQQRQIPARAKFGKDDETSKPLEGGIHSLYRLDTCAAIVVFFPSVMSAEWEFQTAATSAASGRQTAKQISQPGRFHARPLQCSTRRAYLSACAVAESSTPLSVPLSSSLSLSICRNTSGLYRLYKLGFVSLL
ncbi:unnamed protein product [Urochloa humidicola]